MKYSSARKHVVEFKIKPALTYTYYLSDESAYVASHKITLFENKTKPMYRLYFLLVI